jgi:hypothetical protein
MLTRLVDVEPAAVRVAMRSHSRARTGYRISGGGPESTPQ